jgi:hypothetical protein
MTRYFVTPVPWIAAMSEELTQLKTEAERLKKEIVELSGEDAAVIG